ncbi:PqqD family protein [Paenactinomyces guangxiensis]|uniref:PqqD family protein n=1 Tax=Paenactinomyces guangxiensis TaxID=1490290 RepID=A0A7W1WPS8_9BACL|nr:PqqD family protein [Paenactinomyces guangxiensis]MBA4493678.1 PqqD family protein [Paenactinomyces guangxiensis]MBH8590965.1 PqqD family protein [Paenactinomyces guangxiensis]
MKIASHVNFTEIDNQLVIMDTKKNEYYVINETGKIILLALNEGKTIDEGLKRLKNEFNQAENIEKDVKNFIDELIKEKLLEES